MLSSLFFCFKTVLDISRGLLFSCCFLDECDDNFIKFPQIIILKIGAVVIHVNVNVENSIMAILRPPSQYQGQACTFPDLLRVHYNPIAFFLYTCGIESL